MIKALLHKKLQSLLINENFFEEPDSTLDGVVECVKDLLVNLKESIGHKYKLEFFKTRLKDSLIVYKNDSKPKNNFSKIIVKLESEFDKSMLDSIKITTLMMKLSKNGDVENLINAYIETLDDRVENLYKRFKDKLKTNKAYNVINAVNNETNTITYKKFFKKKYFLQIELMKLQEWVIANDKKVLILFEGRDASGKGSNIEVFGEFLNPKYARVETFDIPTEDEKKDWFKRYINVLPEKGEIVLFDRSWYNRGIVEPAMGYCSNKQYKEFMETVNEFEKKLIDKDDIILIKIWLDIKKTKQKLRFELRKRDPLRYWKFSENDEKMINNWDKLTPYIDVVLKDTNTDKSPWIIIDSDDKLNGILSSMKSVLRKINYEDKDKTLLYDEKDGRIVFLDIHGVLINDIKFYKDGTEHCDKGWSKDAINNLNKITDKTGAEIVFISSCKSRIDFEKLKKMLEKAGVTGNIIGKTIDIDKHLREEQIENWLKNHNVDKFVILDDKAYDTKKKFSENLIQPDIKVGLTEPEAKKAIEKLK